MALLPEISCMNLLVLPIMLIDAKSFEGQGKVWFDNDRKLVLRSWKFVLGRHCGYILTENR